MASALVPFYDAMIERHADDCRKFYRGEAVSFIPFGCRTVERAPESARRCDVVFVGEADGFQRRRARLLGYRHATQVPTTHWRAIRGRTA